jgi:hypothetical protein
MERPRFNGCELGLMQSCKQVMRNGWTYNAKNRLLAHGRFTLVADSCDTGYAERSIDAQTVDRLAYDGHIQGSQCQSTFQRQP